MVLEVKTRRIVHAGVTGSPTDEWTAQQLPEAPPWGKGPKYLLHDRDSRYVPLSAMVAGSRSKELRTPYRAPRANGICERFMGSLRRECLDHTLILHRKHLARVVKEHTAYYNHDRPHQGICQQIPHYFDQPHINRSGEIKASLILGGLHYSYSHVTPLISSISSGRAE